MSKYETPVLEDLDLNSDHREMAGRCRTRSQICGHGEDGCSSPGAFDSPEVAPAIQGTQKIIEKK